MLWKHRLLQPPTILVALTGLASVCQCLSWDGEPRAGCSDPAPQILKRGPKTSLQQLPIFSLTDPRARLAFFAGRMWCCLTFTTVPTRLPRSCSAVLLSGQRIPTCTLSDHLILGCFRSSADSSRPVVLLLLAAALVRACLPLPWELHVP